MKGIASNWLGAPIGALAYPARLGIYAAITLASYQVLYLGVEHGGVAWMGSENGPIEMFQVALACAGAAALFYAAWRCPIGRFGLTASGCLLAYAAARELDAFLEAVFFEDIYKYAAGIPLLAAIAAAIWRDGRRAVPEMLWLLRQPQATLFVMAGVFLCTFCQWLDRPGTWQGLAAGDGTGSRALQLTIEESSELFAYWLLLFSSIEGALMARRLARADAASVLGEVKQLPSGDERLNRAGCRAA